MYAEMGTQGAGASNGRFGEGLFNFHVLYAVTEQQVDQLVAGVVVFGCDFVDGRQRFFADSNGNDAGAVLSALF